MRYDPLERPKITGKHADDDAMLVATAHLLDITFRVLTDKPAAWTPT